MIKISTITGLGVLVAVVGMGFLGFPIEWKNFIYVVSGILIAVLSVLIRNELVEVIKHLHTEVIKTDTFSESNPKNQEKDE
ncbi:MAG: hypothetical protein ABIF22_00770 [bacterium]